METTIKKNIPAKEYFAVDAASNSTLGKMKRSAAHCLEYINNPPEQTPAMAFGSMFHSLALEAHTFFDDYVIQPDKKRPTSSQINAKKPSDATVDLIAFWEQWDGENAGKIPVKQDDYDTALAMATSIKNHKTANYFLTDGEAESSLFWQDWEHDYPMKCRIDYIKNGYTVDLKTTEDASLEEFKRSIAKFGYHRQNAVYVDGYKAVTGEDAKGFIFVAVEKKPPYAVAVYALDNGSQEGPENNIPATESSIDKGRTEYRELLSQYIDCKKSGVWPAYSDDVEEISLPGWYK